MLHCPLTNLTHVSLVLAEVGAADPAGGSSRQAFAGMLIALGIALMAILITVSARSKMARRNAERLSPRERIEQIKAAGAKAQAVSEPLAGHLDQMQTIAAILDNKAERLEQLLAEADERIALLRALNQATEDRPAAASASRPASVDPLARSVYELADTGLSPVEIAQELDEQVGKVDLILALRGR